jgi:hypothetical protein
VRPESSARVAALLRAMTIEEKAGQMTQLALRASRRSSPKSRAAWSSLEPEALW